MEILRRHPIIAIFIAAIVLVAIYMFITPRPFCKSDVDVSYRFHNSEWNIRELIYHCSALDGEFEISAVNRMTGKAVQLFFIDGDASTSLTFDDKGIVLLIDKFAEIKQLGKSFASFSASYKRATEAELKSAPKLRPES